MEFSQTDWIYVLPFLCGALWAAGGRPKGRYFRRLGVGLSVAVVVWLYTHASIVILCIPLYWFVTALGYGKYIDQRNWFAVVLIGCAYGGASYPVAAIERITLLPAQIMVSGSVFTLLTYLSNTGRWRPHWAFTEGLTGIASTCVIPYMVMS